MLHLQHINMGKGLKWISAMLIIIVVNGILIKQLAEPILEKRIVSFLNKPGSVYIIRTGSIDIQWIMPGIAFEHLTVKNKADSADIIIDADIGNLNLKGINIIRALFGKDYKIKMIDISNGKMRIKPGMKKEQANPVIFNNSFEIGSLQLTDIRLEYDNVAESSFYFFAGLKSRVHQIEIQKNDTMDSSLINKVNFYSDSAGIYMRDSLYSIIAYGLGFSDAAGVLGADSLKVLPRYKPYVFGARFKYQTDRFEAGLQDIRVHDFEFSRLIENKKLKSSYVQIGNLEMNAFRDKRKEFHHTRKKMLNEALKDLPVKLQIDSLAVLDGRIVYSEHNSGSEKPGMVFFNHVQWTIKNISNTLQKNDSDSILIILGRGMLMNVGRVDVNFRMSLLDPEQAFTLKGKVGRMGLCTLNTIFENNESISLEGTLNSIDFDFTANTVLASGRLIFLYEDLKVKIDDKDGFIKDKVKTWLINLSLINSNPTKDKSPRVGRIKYKRDPERFIINYSLKALMTGIQSTITTE